MRESVMRKTVYDYNYDYNYDYAVGYGCLIRTGTEPLKTKLDKVISENERESDNISAPVVGGGRAYLIAKRCFDIVCALLAGLLLLIPMGIIAVLVRIDSPGAAIFRQERLGKNGKPFTIYKFRSMKVNAEENGPQWADKDDKRCTRLGRILRQSRLDELPQVWNILKGDMSFVGPRPERACFYEKFSAYIPGFENRLLVKPGLSGYAQVNGGYELKPEEKLAFDMEYIQKRTALFDLKVLFQTVRLVITREGAR